MSSRTAAEQTQNGPGSVEAHTVAASSRLSKSAAQPISDRLTMMMATVTDIWRTKHAR